MRLTSLDPRITARIQALAKTKEILAYRLYHYKTFEGDATNGKTLENSISYFSLAVGQEGTGYEDTNMPRPNSIGSGNAMWVQSIRSIVLPAKNDASPFLKAIDTNAIQKSIINDVAKVLNRGVITIKQQSQEVFKVSPISLIPTGYGVIPPQITGETALSAGLPLNSLPLISNGFPVELWLENEQTFDFTLQFETPVVIYNTFRFGFILEGILVRPRIVG